MKQIKILIVEDEAVTARLLKLSLQRMGYTVCEPAATAEAAIATAGQEQPDVILMDIRLAGEMDGIEAARRIALLCDVSIIFMTGYSDRETRERAQALNPAAYLVKPVTPAEIEPLIGALVRGE